MPNKKPNQPCCRPEISKIIPHYIVGFVTAAEQKTVHQHLQACRSCRVEFSRQVHSFDIHDLENICVLGFEILTYLTWSRTARVDSISSFLEADAQNVQAIAAKLEEVGLVRVFKLRGGKMKVNITEKGEEVAQVRPLSKVH